MLKFSYRTSPSIAKNKNDQAQHSVPSGSDNKGCLEKYQFLNWKDYLNPKNTSNMFMKPVRLQIYHSMAVKFGQIEYVGCINKEFFGWRLWRASQWNELCLCGYTAVFGRQCWLFSYTFTSPLVPKNGNFCSCFSFPSWKILSDVWTISCQTVCESCLKKIVCIVWIGYPGEKQLMLHIVYKKMRCQPHLVTTFRDPFLHDESLDRSCAVAAWRITFSR